MKKIVKTNEFFVAITVIVMCMVIGLINPAFFSWVNCVSLLREAIVSGIMAFALMLGIIAGGIDVCFPAIAVCSMYITQKLMEKIAYDGALIWPILMAVGIGTVLGFINGFIITQFHLPAFIVTLGTSSLFYGLLVSVLGSKPVNRLVPVMEEFSKSGILSVSNGTLSSTLPWTFLFLVGMGLIVHFILKYTMLGRGIYAIGGDKVSAERAGFNVKWITIFVYTFIGMAGGLAGITHSIQCRNCIPTNLYGCEMMVIAAVVLGGTKISGGKGTVLGTILGLALITISQNSLILVGIPSHWQRFATGVIIVAGTALSAYQALKASNKIPRILDEEKVEEG